MAEGQQLRNLAVPCSQENGRSSSKLIKISEGEDDHDQTRKRRAVIMETTGVVCISSNDIGINGLEGGGASEKSSESDATCPVCYKIFGSKKAMYGHMRCHPEREWRGVNPPDTSPPPPPSSAAAKQVDSSSSAVPQKRDDFSPSAMKSTVVAVAVPYTTTTTSLCQFPIGWLATGRRGQNHPLSFCHTSVSSSGELGIKDKNQVDHGKGDNNTEEEEEEEEEESGGGGKNASDGDGDGGKSPLLVAPREYKCSSCDKVFGTFQALGGHRASHSYKNKVEAMDGGEEESKEGGSKDKGVGDRFKCNICSKTFPSGQALGGHKRTHFQATPTSPYSVVYEEGAGKSLAGKVLDFDINDLPPMEE